MKNYLLIQITDKIFNENLIKHKKLFIDNYKDKIKFIRLKFFTIILNEILNKKRKEKPYNKQFFNELLDNSIKKADFKQKLFIFPFIFNIMMRILYNKKSNHFISRLKNINVIYHQLLIHQLTFLYLIYVGQTSIIKDAQIIQNKTIY